MAHGFPTWGAGYGGVSSHDLSMSLPLSHSFEELVGNVESIYADIFYVSDVAKVEYDYRIDLEIARILLNEALGHHRIHHKAIAPYARSVLVDRVLERLQREQVLDVDMVEVRQILRNLCTLLHADHHLLE